MSLPFCLFCEESKMKAPLDERDVVTSTKLKMKAARLQYSASISEEDFRNHEAFMPLTNGYCTDTASILGAENLDLLSPLIALEDVKAFPVVKAFLQHIFTHFKMIDELQRPNACLILTEPSNLPLAVKELLLKYLFEEVQVSRLCLLPKALAISLLFDCETCVVVDSGATSTSVWVVMDGKVDTTRTRTVPVGGWHVSQFLKQALTWKEHKEAAVTTISSLDSR